MILPPIIFAGGFNLRKTMFFENFGLISFYGVVGTILSFLVIAVMCVLLLQTGIFFSDSTPLAISDMLQFAAVLCATDTVAAVSLVKESQYPKLNSVLFGEGIVNDAIAIVIFRSVKNFIGSEDGVKVFDVEAVVLILLDFVKLLLLSVVVGLTIGLLISLFFKNFSTYAAYPLRETSIIMLAGYFSYLLAEVLGLSGNQPQPPLARSLALTLPLSF